MSEPIWDEAAERAVLGCALLSPSAFELAMQAKLATADFWEPRHGTVWAAMVSLWNEGKPTDRVSVLDELDRRGRLRSDIGPFLSGLVSFDELPTTANMAYHVEIVVRKAKWRGVVQAATAVSQLGEASVESGDPDGALELLRREVERAGDVHTTSNAVPVADALDSYLASLDEPLAGVVPTPWPSLDKLLHGGLHKRDLTILAARTSVGKTLIALNMTRAAVRSGVPVDYYSSSEMSSDELLARLMANEASVPWEHLAAHSLTSADWDRVKRAADRIAEWPLRIDDTLDGMTVADIRARCRLSARRGLGMVVVDQLSSVEPSDPRLPEQKQLDQSALRLRQMAGELDVPVLLLHQLNRGPADRPDKKPNMDTDLRGSDAPTHHAHKVILLWRQEDKPGEMTAIVAKHRNGKRGEVELRFEGIYARAVSPDLYPR